MHQVEIPIVWDAVSTQSLRLGPILLGRYEERICGTLPTGNGTGDNAGNMTRAQQTVMQTCTVRHEEPLEISFECQLEHPQGNERCLSHGVSKEHSEHDGETTETRWTNALLTPSACLADEQDQLRCLIRPVMDPKYEALWTRYQNAKNFWDPVRFNRAFAGTEFPWTPCHDPALYSDNAIRIVNLKEAAKRTPPNGNTPAPVDTRPKVEEGWCELASGLALSSASPAEWLTWARRQYPEQVWTSAKWEALPSIHERDECARYWNEHRLVLKAGNYERYIVFNKTRSQPQMENPWVAPGVIEIHEQCYKDAHDIARKKLERMSNRELVRARHPCHPSNANEDDQHAYFMAEYNWFPVNNPLRHAPNCLNSAEINHSWRAQSCGAHVEHWVIVRIRDTYAPLVNMDFVNVYTAPGRPLTRHSDGQGWVWNTCVWPEQGFTRTAGLFRPIDDIPRLVRREILQSGRSMFQDQCDPVEDLQILPEWTTAVWEYCSLMQDGDGRRHLSCTEQPQLKLAELAAGGGGFPANTLKVRDENLVVSDTLPRLLRMKVKVHIGDACGNVAFAHPIQVQVGLFDPVDIPMGLYKEVQCPHFRYPSQ